MTRSILGAVVLGLFVTACGSNNGSGSTHECGDGVVDTGEQCDDGNTASGDGCSSVCKIETANTCGNGTVEVATEQCDDGNTVSGDGCSATCQTETSTTCGNGTLETGETCDDGNTAAADGCSATCQTETGYTCTGSPSVCTMGSTATGTGTCADPLVATFTGAAATVTGDTTNATNQIDEGRCDWSHFTGSGPDQNVKFTLTAASDVTFTLTTDFDASLRLMSTVCDATTQIADTVAHDGCANLGFAGDGEQLVTQRLAAGTYFISVDGYDDTELGAWSLAITTSAPTGVCGDGNLDSFEQCDDSNTTANDRCSATCTLEFDTTDTEPNDDYAHAQVITPVHHIIKGSLGATDVDFYKFTLTTATTVEIETYDAEDPNSDNIGLGSIASADCIFDEHTVSLFNTGDAAVDYNDDTTAVASDDGFNGDYDDVSGDGIGIGACAYVGPNNADATTLQPGTYVIKIEPYLTAQKNYILDVKFSATTTTTAVAPGAGDLKINEVMLADNLADTNCDGSTSNTYDEFVELVNVTTHAIDLTGVTISDAVTVRHTFASTNTGTGSMTLPAGKAIVVWGGGAPACAGVTNFFVASTANGLGLNDTGDTVTVSSGATTVATATFGASTLQKSFNLSPDVTGTTYALHDAITGHVNAFSPGKKNDGTAF